MSGKITLITPPDFFENSNPSVLFVHISDAEQDAISKWLGSADFKTDINFYVYTGETNVTWFLYALNRCEYKYINMDCVNNITRALSGYALGKSRCFYKTTDENLSGIYSHINSNRVSRVEDFLEIILGANQVTALGILAKAQKRMADQRRECLATTNQVGHC